MSNFSTKDVPKREERGEVALSEFIYSFNLAM